LVAYIDTKIEAASRFITNFMPVDTDTDTTYEALLECSTSFFEATKDHMVQAFKDAVQYLPPSAQHKRLNINLDARTISIVVRLNPTEKWPVFLFPTGELVITPESKLAKILEIPVRVAMEWEQLNYMWTNLHSDDMGLDNPQLAYLMPWIREVLADFDTTQLPVDVKQAERKAIDREVATIMRDTTVPFYPRLSKALTTLARSGKMLFSQYRLLEATYNERTLERSLITVEPTPNLLEVWVHEHMRETISEWHNDKSERIQRALNKVVKSNSGE
jgi:hypothetical protein